jgi:hypothetical protein
MYRGGVVECASKFVPLEETAMKRLPIVGLTLACAASASAQKLDVKIIDRQDNQTEYTYVVPKLCIDLA